jgi:hypothetical protein
MEDELLTLACVRKIFFIQNHIYYRTSMFHTASFSPYLCSRQKADSNAMHGSCFQFKHHWMNHYMHTYCLITYGCQVANCCIHLSGIWLQLSDISDSEKLCISASEQFKIPSITTDTDKFHFYYVTPFMLTCQIFWIKTTFRCKFHKGPIIS